LINNKNLFLFSLLIFYGSIQRAFVGALKHFFSIEEINDFEICLGNKSARPGKMSRAQILSSGFIYPCPFIPAWAKFAVAVNKE